MLPSVLMCLPRSMALLSEVASLSFETITVHSEMMTLNLSSLEGDKKCLLQDITNNNSHSFVCADRVDLHRDRERSFPKRIARV